MIVRARSILRARRRDLSVSVDNAVQQVRSYARPRRLTTGPYLVRNPAVLAAMLATDAFGLVVPRRKKHIPLDRPLRVLVANTGHLGDSVIMLPLLEKLRRDPRVGTIGVLIGPWSRPIFEGLGLVEHIHEVSHWTFDREAGGFYDKLDRYVRSRTRAIRALRHVEYDVALDAYAWFGNASYVLWAAAIPMRSGFTSGGGGTLYTNRIRFDPRGAVVANQQRVFTTLLRELESPPPLASYPGFLADEQVKQRLDELGRFVVLHLGAGSHQRSWPAAFWVETCQRLQACGFNVVFTGAPAEAEYVRPICQLANGYDFAGKLNFRGFATLIQSSQGLVCVDTVAGHLAASFEVPSAVLVNGIQPLDRWRPNQRYARVLTHRVGCYPCSRTSGCSSMACLTHVDPQRVCGTLLEMIAAKQHANGSSTATKHSNAG